jgi:hypothetical protein
MSFKKLTLTVAADGSHGTGAAGAVVDRTFGESVVDTLAAPFKMTAAEDQYVQEKQVGIASSAWAVGSFLIGEAFGHRRARMGAQSFVPVFRG